MSEQDVRGARRDDRASAWLREPSGPPADPGRFTPDLYPAGPPLVPAPAAGHPLDDRAVGDDLATFLEVHLGGNRARIDVALERFHDERVVERLPDATVRAGS